MLLKEILKGNRVHPVEPGEKEKGQIQTDPLPQRLAAIHNWPSNHIE